MITDKTTEPTWTEAEHDEIMRLHIIESLTISGAKWRVFNARHPGEGATRIVRKLKA